MGLRSPKTETAPVPPSVRKVTPDKVLEEVSPYGGKVLRTSLSKDQEAQLQEVLTSRGVTT